MTLRKRWMLDGLNSPDSMMARGRPRFPGDTPTIPASVRRLKLPGAVCVEGVSLFRNSVDVAHVNYAARPHRPEGYHSPRQS